MRIKNFHLPLLLLCVFFCAGNSLAQDTKWIKFENFVKELSFRIPDGYTAFRNQRKTEAYLSSYQNKVSINVLLQKYNGKRLLGGLDDRYDQFDCKSDSYMQGEISGKIFTCESDKQYSKTIYLGTDSRYCKIILGADKANNPDVALFLSSLRVRGIPIFPEYGNKPEPEEKGLSDSDIKNSAVVKEYMNIPDNEVINVGRAQDTPNAPLFDADSPIYSRQLIIINKVFPAFPPSERGMRGAVTVKLRVHFLASGRIEKVELMDNSGVAFVNAAIDSLRKMKFLPPQIDGKSVDLSRTMEFNFATF